MRLRLQRTSILVVEDDWAQQVVLRRALLKSETEVSLYFVRDGLEVVKYLLGEASFGDRTAHPLPNLLFVDLKMPAMSGFDVVSWIRANAQFKALPVIIFTSSEYQVDVNKAYEVGANCFLVKPFNLEDTAQLLSKVVEYWLFLSRLPEAPGTGVSRGWVLE